MYLFFTLFVMATRTFNEMVDEVTDRVAKCYDGHPWENAIIDIKNLIDELNWTWVSGKVFQDYSIDELSRMWGVMAVQRSSMIELRSFVMKNIAIMKARLGVRKGSARGSARDQLTKIHLAKKIKAPTVDDIKAEMERMLAETELELGLHEEKLEFLNSVWFSVPTILNRIDQRIHVLMGDKDTVRHYGDSSPLDVVDSTFAYEEDIISEEEDLTTVETSVPTDKETIPTQKDTTELEY